MLPWGAVDRTGKAGVAASTTSAPRHGHHLTVRGQIGQAFSGIGVIHQRAYRDIHDAVSTVPPVTVAAFAVAATFGGIARVVAKGEQRVEMVTGPEIDRAAIAAVAAGRSAARHELFTAESHTAIAAIATSDIDDGFVNKHRTKHKAQGWSETLGLPLGVLPGASPTPTLLCAGVGSQSFSGRGGCFGRGRWRFQRNDLDVAPKLSTVAETQVSGLQGKERVVTPQTDIAPRFEAGATLPNQNFTGLDELIAKTLDTEALRMRVAPVAGTSNTFFMSHGWYDLVDEMGSDRGQKRTTRQLRFSAPAAP